MGSPFSLCSTSNAKADDPRKPQSILESREAPAAPILPSNRPFVVPFRAPPADASPAREGRVEPRASGQVLRCPAPEEDLVFLTRVLSEGLEPSWAC